MLFKFGIVSQSLCSFRNSEEETPFNIFHDCTHTQNLWNQLQTYISENLVIPCLTPPRAMFGFIDTQQENRVIINHSLLIFKFNFYESRELKILIFLRLKSDIINLRQIETMSNQYSKTEKVVQKMGETNKCILPLNNVFDLKKKVLFTLNVFKKTFVLDMLTSWVRG